MQILAPYMLVIKNFLAQYIEHLGLYKRNFMSGKFAIYYQILEEENLIRIIHFRSNKQKPL